MGNVKQTRITLFSIKEKAIWYLGLLAESLGTLTPPIIIAGVLSQSITFTTYTVAAVVTLSVVVSFAYWYREMQDIAARTVTYVPYRVFLESIRSEPECWSAVTKYFSILQYEKTPVYLCVVLHPNARIAVRLMRLFRTCDESMILNSIIED